MLILMAVVSVASPRFLTYRNWMNLLQQWAPAGIMAVGMTYVILTGGFDLSIASGYSLVAVTAAGLGMTVSPPLAFLGAIMVGVAIGVVNGLLVTVARINAFIATVGTGFIISGITLVLTDNQAFIPTNPAFSTLGSGRFHGVPYPGMILLAFLIVGGIVLARTVYGEYVYAVGGNAEASRLSGVRVTRVTLSAWIFMGLCVGIAGVISASQLSSAQANMNPKIVFDVMTIVVVGGTSLAGGVGSMWRTAVGLVIIATISNGFNLANVNPFYQDIVKGCIIVGALTLDVWAGRIRRPALRVPKQGDDLAARQADTIC